MKNYFLLLPALATALMIGCWSDPAARRIAELTEGNLTKVGMMYKMFSNAHKFAGPADEVELKEWIQGSEAIAKQLSRFGINVARFDDYMVSENTGEKFEIRWGVKSRPMAPPYPVAYDNTPVDGIRQVGMAGGPTLDVKDDALFEKLKKGEYDPKDFK